MGEFGVSELDRRLSIFVRRIGADVDATYHRRAPGPDLGRDGWLTGTAGISRPRIPWVAHLRRRRSRTFLISCRSVRSASFLAAAPWWSGVSAPESATRQRWRAARQDPTRRSGQRWLGEFPCPDMPLIERTMAGVRRCTGDPGYRPSRQRHYHASACRVLAMAAGL
jgi:hypothetical protein